jgi:tetratricopeptide (TPR) repeat protein
MSVRPLAYPLPGHRIAYAAFCRAEYTFALKAAEELEPTSEAHVLRSMILRYLGRHEEAVHAARMGISGATTNDEKALAFCALANTQLATGLFNEARATLARVETPASELSVSARSEIGFLRTVYAYVTGDPERAELEIIEAYRDPNPHTRSRVLQIHAFICGLKENYRESCKLFVRALDEIDKSPVVHLHSQILMAISFLASEVDVKVDLADMRRRLREMSWTEHMGTQRYWAHRNFGLRLALDGGVGAQLGLRLLSKSAEYAVKPTQKVLAILDSSATSFHYGEPHNGASWLTMADELAAQTDWAAEGGDERIALLIAAELFAETQPQRADGYLRLFESLPPMSNLMALSHGSRMPATVAHAKGVVARYGGRTEEAVAQFKVAFELFKKASYQWRQAESALQIYQITGDERYRKRGQRLIRPHSESWIAEMLDPVDV